MKGFLLLVLAVCLSAQDKQMALGERMAQQIRKRTTPAEPRVQEYVSRLAKRLTPADSHWQINVLSDDFGGSLREPVWVPGYLFVPARLLLMTGSEAELAGVLAHAMAHSVERLDGQSVFFLNWSDDTVPFGRVEQERAMERGADLRAVATLAAAGFDPHGLLEYIRRLQPVDENKNSRLPPHDERVAALQEAIARTPTSVEWVENSSAFVTAQERVRRSVAGRTPRRPSLLLPNR